MDEASRTTRERMTDRLREETLTPSALAREFEVTAGEALTHVDHIAKSLAEGDETLLAAPPTCQECEFDDFDNLVNRPSRCPECKSEKLSEPAFRVE